VSSTQTGHAPEPTTPADLVLTGGRILQVTVPEGDLGRMLESTAQFASALAVLNGLIVSIGSDAEIGRLVGSSTRVVHLNGQLVLPGLIDSHIHGVRPTVCDLDYMPGTDLDAVLAKIGQCLLREDQLPFLQDENSLLRVTGFSSTTDPGQSAMNRQVLDRLSRNPDEDPLGVGTRRPITVAFSGYHSEWLNSRALEIAGIGPDPYELASGDIDRDTEGIPTGKLTDVYGIDIGTEPPLSMQVLKDAKLATLAALTRFGITGTFVAGGDPIDLVAWAQIADEGGLSILVNQGLWANDIRGMGSESSRDLVDGFNQLRDRFSGYRNSDGPGELVVDTAKIMCDGVTEYPGQTAAMFDPYRTNVGTHACPHYVAGKQRGEDPSCSDSLIGFQALHDESWSIMTHALGNRAVAEALDNFEVVQESNTWDARHVVTHGQFIREQDTARFAQLGVIYNTQAQWIAANSFIEELIRPFVTEADYRTQFPLRSVMARGGIVAGGSDWPVDPLNPWLSIQTAVTRESSLSDDRGRYPGALGSGDEALTRLQSVVMHTLASAYQMHRDHRTGSLEVGKDADLVIVDQDILDPGVSVHSIHETKALLTMFRGTIVHDAGPWV
jgi:predicted amidohydrolase YtcJ